MSDKFKILRAAELAREGREMPEGKSEGGVNTIFDEKEEEKPLTLREIIFLDKKIAEMKLAIEEAMGGGLEREKIIMENAEQVLELGLWQKYKGCFLDLYI